MIKLFEYLKSLDGHDVTKRAIIEVNSIVSGRNVSLDYRSLADVMYYLPLLTVV